VAHGSRYGLLTVAGTSTAMLLQLALVALGMTPLLAALGSWFELLRWIGVAYLVYLGIREWRAPAVDLTRTRPERKSPRSMFTRALLVSMTNPKTLLFYGAFFPQFVSSDHAFLPQVLLLSATFVVIAVLVDGSWALAAARTRHLLATRGRLRNRIAGGMLMGAGAVLAMARHK
jgi:threonine/homoserine/homoserine lactone efflux protein